jgi:hypothetical protein
VFGCVCLVHTKGNKYDKLDSRAVKCVFIGYSSSQKGYKCFDPITKRRYISMDVIFFEKQPYFDSKRDNFHKDLTKNEEEFFFPSQVQYILDSNTTEQSSCSLDNEPKQSKPTEMKVYTRG